MPSPAATAHLDQVRAATNQARTAVRAAALHSLSPVQTRPPNWVLAHISAFQLAVVDGRADYCPHLPAGPTVLHAAVWAPNLITCTACVHLLMPGPAEDSTCDRCRHQVNPLHAGATTFGPLILAYGLCTPCLTTIRKETR